MQISISAPDINSDQAATKVLTSLAHTIDPTNALGRTRVTYKHDSCFAIVANALKQNWNTVKDDTQIVLFYRPGYTRGAVTHAILYDPGSHKTIDKYTPKGGTYTAGEGYSIPKLAGEGNGETHYDILKVLSIKDFKKSFFK